MRKPSSLPQLRLPVHHLDRQLHFAGVFALPCLRVICKLPTDNDLRKILPIILRGWCFDKKLLASRLQITRKVMLHISKLIPNFGHC